MKRFAYSLAAWGLLMQGSSGDTPVRIGIVGIVEGTDPLVVAGQAVRVPETLPILSALGGLRQISVGDTLAVRARFADGGFLAERILEFYAVAGPVTARNGAEATVLGTPVHVPGDADPKIGDWVALSGLWSGGKVITTAVHPSDRGGLAQLSGVFDLFDGEGPPRLGGTAILAVAPLEGDLDTAVWTVTGVPEGDALRVRTMARGLFGGEVDLEFREGYASGPIASETWMVHGSDIHGYDREADMPATGARVRVCAIGGRVIRVAPADATPQLAAAMAALACG